MLNRFIKFFLFFLSACVVFKIFADFLSSSEVGIAAKSIWVIIIGIAVMLTIAFGKVRSPLTLKSFVPNAILIGIGLCVTLNSPDILMINSFTDHLIAFISLVGNCCIIFPAIILTSRLFSLVGQKKQGTYQNKSNPKPSHPARPSVPSKHVPRYMFEDELLDAVLIKNQSGEFVDKTYSIRDIIKNDGFYEVSFNNAKKPYRYGVYSGSWIPSAR